MSVQIYDFDERLNMSHGASTNASVESILLKNIPGSIMATLAGQQDDRQGTDWWVTLGNKQRISVDCKVRGKDYSLEGKDDLALETWSVVEKRICGWTRNPLKLTDYILWLWTDTGRWCLVPFRMLCGVFIENWQTWRECHKVATQYTPGFTGWHSECIFVPRRTVWAEIYKKYAGSPKEVA